MLVLLVAAAVFALDRLSKFAVTASFVPGESRPVIPGLLWWTYSQNVHGAFGLFGNSPVVLTLLATCVLVVFAFAFRDGLRRSRFVQISFGMILGGALGNILDRVQHQYVVDFIDFKTIWPDIFNVGDSAITVGVALLLLGTLRRSGSNLRREEQRGTP